MRGLILGKFLPPHRGHRYLVDFARHYADDLTVVVGSLPSELIPGELRFRWMRESFPDVTVVHLPDELPQEPREHPRFWELWREALLRVAPRRPDLLFASEDYGDRLAAELGAAYVPVDHARELLPVSGTAVRTDPYDHWDDILPAARPWFLSRVCIMGPESTGKTSLARYLARHFDTVWVAEYARPLLARQGDRVDPEDIPRIARGHAASEDALALQATRVLVVDTDLLTTTLWSDILFGDCPAWIRDEARRRSYDLTLLMDHDCPFVHDPQRFLPDRRGEFFERCRALLEDCGRPYVVVGGSWDERCTAATAAVEELMSQGPPALIRARRDRGPASSPWPSSPAGDPRSDR